MGKSLTGKRIVIAGSRKTDELCLLIQKQGGTPVVRPMQGTVFFAEKEMESDLKRVLETGANWVILTTGAGTEALLEYAEKLGLHTAFLQLIEQAKVAARGYKTFAVLKKLGIKPLAVDEDGTVQGLIRELAHMDFREQRVVVQLHGEPAPALHHFLQGKGAEVLELMPYQHIPPQEDVVRTLCSELLNGQADAVCFTTAIQVRNLFQYARNRGLDGKLRGVFERSALAVAVGKVTGEALKEEGLQRLLVAQTERMGAMIIELAQYYDNNQ